MSCKMCAELWIQHAVAGVESVPLRWHSHVASANDPNLGRR
jgi:hypothetical protein